MVFPLTMISRAMLPSNCPVCAVPELMLDVNHAVTGVPAGMVDAAASVAMAAMAIRDLQQPAR
jgi:hypothetical protein